MGSDPDTVLVSRCRAGDSDAWALLVDRHRPVLIELARRFLPRADAEDIVDATIADIWHRRKLDRFEGRSTLATWLGAIVIHASLNARRAARIRAKAIADTNASELQCAPMAGGDRAKLSEVLNEAIAALPVESRLLILLYYEQGLTLDQAGVVLARSKSTLSRLLRQVQEEIRTRADHLAREQWGTTLVALRGGADLVDLDFDLKAACRREGYKVEGQVSKS